MTPIIFRVGLPDFSAGAFYKALCRAQAKEYLSRINRCVPPIMVSARAFWRRGTGFRKVSLFHAVDVALDSAGFTAMKLGGYPWSLDEYLDWVFSSTLTDARGWFPWAWWAAMDYCVEPQIAKDRPEVLRKLALTASTLDDTLQRLDWWRWEGDNEIPDPLATIQGWLPDDYRRSIGLLTEVFAARDRDWPDLVGVGSVCRRNVAGPAGVVAVVEAIDRALPAGVGLHLFGVKTEALQVLKDHPRVVGADSMAWSVAARRKLWRQARGAISDAVKRGATDEEAHLVGRHTLWRSRAKDAEVLTEWATEQLQGLVR